MISSEGFVVANKQTEEASKRFTDNGEMWFDFKTDDRGNESLVIGQEGSNWKTVTTGDGYELRYERIATEDDVVPVAFSPFSAHKDRIAITEFVIGTCVVSGNAGGFTIGVSE